MGDLVRLEADLVVPDDTRAECAVLKGVAAHFVMNVAERVELMAGERDIVADLVTAYREDPSRLDADLLADHEVAASDEAALRVVVDQVASLTDVRARHLHALWC